MIDIQEGGGGREAEGGGGGHHLNTEFPQQDVSRL